MGRLKEAMMLDLFSGKELKTHGIITTLKHEGDGWKASVKAVVSRMPSGLEFTAETLKDHPGIKEPHHVNCWGAALHVMGRMGLILPTGRYVKAERPSRHAAVIQVWRRA